jgi:small-conductance mechanosensitive channel
MNVTNAGEALDAGRGSIEQIANWFIANQAQLPIGLAAAAAIIAFMLLVRWAGSMMRDSDPDCLHFRGIIGRMLARTSIFFMAATAVEVVATYADVPAKIGRIADILFIIAFAFQGAIWARELILGAITRKVGDDKGESTLANAMALIRVLVSVALFAIALIVILDNLGVNVTALVAGLGVGGIAIGLAAQGIFSDLFAALSILFDRPFRRGDTINYGGGVDTGGTTGTVERIGLKTTRIRSRSGELVVMANTKLLEQELTNIDEASVYRAWLPFGVIYQTDPAVLERMSEITAKVLKGIKGIRFVRCAVSGFGDSSIDFQLVYDDVGKDFDTRAMNRSAICIGILKTFRAEGIEFAYPTQTTFTSAPDGTMIMPYAQVQPVMPVEVDTEA